ncbi:YbaN family protein [Shewanella sp. 202IG2-18]|uniref:YbaN family protein n=1 Tax=Parashewanella hymeniacidonis TaxID=2807618 RepID=UPI001960C9B5|nr:YbaN family protein [Parashewanella hymeniacidonis]MBM7073340.1 YbaN family protein [Parashewanella hymeniacidonis]
MYLKKGFFLVVGVLSVFLGTLGIFLPLLPTVPFILLAVFCFARSSERLHRWLVNHPWFAVAIADWQRERGIRKTIKKRAMILSAASFILSISIVPLFWVKGLLFVMMLILLTYLWRLPTLPD